MSKVVKKIVRPVKRIVFGSSPKISSYTPKVVSYTPKPLSPSEQEEQLSGFLQSQYTSLLSQTDLPSTFAHSFSLLQDISEGHLPEPYQKAIETQFKERLGGLLNNLAQRGIINSSVAQNAISDALQKTADLSVAYLGEASRLARLPFEFAKTASLLPYDWYRLLYTSRYRLPSQPIVSTPIVQEGSPGLLGGLLGGVSTVLGKKIGDIIFSKF